MDSGGAVLSVRGLTRRFGKLEAVAGIDFDVARGEVVALLGPNGAGKTTTLTCIGGLLAPNAGTITVAGDRERAARERRVAYVPEVPVVYDDLTPAEHLAFVAAGRRIDDADTAVDRALERTGLSEVRDRPAGTLSKGNRQRLCLAGVLLARADVVLLDEPTTGLDPAAQHALIGLVRELAAGGAGVVLSTHALATAFEAADRIAVLVAGRIVLDEPAARFADLEALRAAYLHVAA
ncbi:MAG TPA: heme ABC exporter ATP-binding protein CcmA [Candidatus Elarobacter sp.]|jgi:ABC-2 type transport system ATP-binding protein|nr:heme ABC exporter ATP-binding protein CcmA [Candidatus Elarobacter sp.]